MCKGWVQVVLVFDREGLIDLSLILNTFPSSTNKFCIAIDPRVICDDRKINLPKLSVQ